MPAPVSILSDIGNTCDTGEPFRFNKLEKLLPHRGKVDQMERLSQIFLCDLQFHHIRCLTNLVEDRTVWLTRLEVKGTVLGLQDDILMELAVQRLELRDRLFHTVLSLMVGTIDKAAPHDDTLIRLQSLRQHISTVSVRALIVTRSGLSLTIRLHEETAEVRD